MYGEVSNSDWRRWALCTWFLFGRVIEGKLQQVVLLGAGCWLLMHAVFHNIERLAVVFRIFLGKNQPVSS